MAAKILFSPLAAALLASCAPYAYRPEITGFANSVDAIVSSHQTGEQTIATQIAQQRQAALVSSRARLDLLDGCDSVDPTGNPPKLQECAVVKFGESQAPNPTPVQVHLAKDEPLFAALKAYAGALAAVSNAGDAQTLTQSTQGLTSAAAGLAGAIAKIAPAAPSAASVTSAGGLIGTGISLYLDSRRYAVLRTIVPAMDQSIGTLAETVEADLYDIRAQTVLRLQKQLHTEVAPLQSPSVNKLSASDYQSKLAALQTTVATFNQARAVDPKATATAMANAHHQLAVALQARSGQLEPVLNAVATFAAAASQVKAAVDAAAGTKPTAPK